nr:hypothetical protein [Bryobacter sp.]
MATLGVRFLTVPLWVAAVAGIAPANEGELRQARQLEAAGNPAQARTLLRDAARANSATAEQLVNYAEFLDRRHDPEARAAYERALKAVSGPARKQAIARRLVALDLLANDRAAAARHLADYREAGGQGLSLPEGGAPAPTAGGQIEIPGPIHSFSRMAALSPDLKPEELLGALARNVVTNGYQAGGSQEGLEQTEYLKLVVRYLSQARELEKLAGDKKAIAVEQCDSAVTGDLLKVLGYRMRGGCGAEVVLETVNASRAFLTIDSGFPLAELEAALRANKPFQLDYKPTVVPVLYGQDYWLGARDKGADEKTFIDAFLADPQLCRLYLGLSKLDPDTAAEIRKAVPSSRLRAFAHVLDFYGGMFQVRNGRALTPGGTRAEKMWGELAGAPPEQGVAFYEKLLTRDDGWLASYYDSLMRITDPVQSYLTEPERLKRFYTAIRGRITSPGPARPVFRANTDMLLLTTRLRLEGDGKPHIPGGIETWRTLFTTHPHGKYDGKLTKAATNWKEPDDVVEALFALSRKAVENEPLKMYMMLSDINRRRAKPLEKATVDRLLLAWRPFASQYSLFTEAPAISDRTILQFLDDAKAVNDIRDPGVRSDVAGMYQSLLSLWQIFTRQGLIPEA